MQLSPFLATNYDGLAEAFYWFCSLSLAFLVALAGFSVGLHSSPRASSGLTGRFALTLVGLSLLLCAVAAHANGKRGGDESFYWMVELVGGIPTVLVSLALISRSAGARGASKDKTFSENVALQLRRPPERVVIIENSAKFDPAALKDGVVMLFAAWSAPCRAALSTYSERLEHLAPARPFWILNVNTLTKDVNAKFEGVKQGHGELFFFRDSVQLDQLVPSGLDTAEEFERKWRSVFGAETQK